MKKHINFAHTAAMTMLLVLMLTAAQTAWAQDPPVITDPPTIDGLKYNSEDGYYEIPDYEALVILSDYVGADNTCEGLTFKVTGDIVFPETEAGESNFTQIGTRVMPFYGTFDGNNKNYSIKGLCINGGGLFCSNYGVIQNVTIVESFINHNEADNCGSIVSNNYGTVENCTSSASIKSSRNNCGGIVGSIYAGTVKNCTSSATVTSSSSDCGGIVGSNYAGTVENCTSSATVTSSGSNCGGIVGGNYANVTVKNCTSSATVTSSGTSCGGIVGWNSGTVEYCTSSATVTSDRCQYCGGVVGDNYSTGTISRCCAIEATLINSATYVGVIAGRKNRSGKLENNYYYNCTVNGVFTNIGCGGDEEKANVADIIENDGALAIFKLTLADGITASPDPIVNGCYAHGKEITFCYSGALDEGQVVAYSATAGEISGNTLIMPEQNVSVTAIVGNEYSVTLPEHAKVVSKTFAPTANGKYAAGTVIKFKAEIPYSWSDVKNGDVSMTPNDNGEYTVEVKESDIVITANVIEPSSGISISIRNTDDLDALSAYVNAGNTCKGLTFVVTQDIKYDGKTENNFTPINGFAGVFDGNHKTISGIRFYNINDLSLYGGLFSVLSEDGTVKNVILANTSIFGVTQNGGIAGINKGSITGCIITSDVTISSIEPYKIHQGGIVGENQSIALEDNFVFGASINCGKSSNMGAIAGRGNPNVKNNYYYNCTINGTPNTINCGFNGKDIEGQGDAAVAVFKLTLADGITLASPKKPTVSYGNSNYYKAGVTLELSGGSEYYANGVKIEGDEFTMPSEDVIISTTAVPSITIDGDGEDAVVFTKEITANVTYIRNFTANIPTTIMLPFDFEASDFNGDVFYSFAGVDETKWEASMKEVAANDGKVILSANTPYIFVPSETTANMTSFTFSGVTVKTTTTQAVSDKDKKWAFKGTYDYKSWNTDGERTITNVYGFAATSGTNQEKGKIVAGDFVRAGLKARIRPTRAYLEYTGTNETLQKSAIALPDRITVVFIDKETASVIDNPSPDPSDRGDVTTPTSELAPTANVKVWSFDKTVYIAAAPNTAYRIIDANGRVLKDGITQSDRDEVRLGRSNGIVVVIINGKTYKVAY